MSDYDESPLCRRTKATRLRRVVLDDSTSSFGSVPSTLNSPASVDSRDESRVLADEAERDAEASMLTSDESRREEEGEDEEEMEENGSDTADDSDSFIAKTSESEYVSADDGTAAEMSNSSDDVMECSPTRPKNKKRRSVRAIKVPTSDPNESIIVLGSDGEEVGGEKTSASDFSLRVEQVEEEDAEEQRKLALLAECEDDEARAFLLEMYPELTPSRLKNQQKKVVDEDARAAAKKLVFDSEEEKEEEKPREKRKPRKAAAWYGGAAKEEKTGKKAPSDRSSSDDDAFDKYLDKLRTGSEKEPSPSADTDSFFVDDDSDEVICDEGSSGSEVSPDMTSSSDEERRNRKRSESRGRKTKGLQEMKNSFNSPSLYKPKKCPDEHFLQSLNEDYQGTRHPDAAPFVRSLRGKARDSLVSHLFQLFHRTVLSSMPTDLEIKWNPRLYKTAGLCRNKRNGTAVIDLSPKVCTTAARVRDTLIHELCHAAVWVIDKRAKEGHGPMWKKWAASVNRRFPSLPVIERCHDYEIVCKYVYVCTGCGQKVKRHSKSLDTNKKICGVCRSHFELFVNGKKASTALPEGAGSGKAEPAKKANGFAVYVKENYAVLKQLYKEMSHSELMKELSVKYKEEKAAAAAREKEQEQFWARREKEMEGKENRQDLDISVLSIHD